MQRIAQNELYVESCRDKKKLFRGILQRVILCKAKLSLCSKPWVERHCILLQKIHKNTRFTLISRGDFPVSNVPVSGASYHPCRPLLLAGLAAWCTKQQQQQQQQLCSLPALAACWAPLALLPSPSGGLRLGWNRAPWPHTFSAGVIQPLLAG